MYKANKHFERNKKIEPEVIKIISEVTSIDESKINLTSDLVKELGLDSFAGVELQFTLEDFFDIKCSDDEMKQLKTVEDITKLVHKKLNI